MSFPNSDPAQPRRPFAAARRRPRALVPAVLVIVGLIVLFTVFTSFMTDLLWYRSVDYADVFTTKLATRGVLFGVFGLVMAGVVCLNIIVAYRLRPTFRGMSAEQQNLDRYRLGLESYRTMIVVVAGIVLGVMAGASAAGEWRTWLQWRNSTSFGVKDPQFGKDVSFYMFSYPWWRFLLGFGFAVVLVSLLASLVTHYLYGGLRLQTPGEKATPAAQAHLSVLLGLFVLLKAVAYWMDRYGLAVKGGGFGSVEGWTGLRYRDVNAVLPAKTILAAIALICALLFFANVVRRTWMLPGIGFGLLVLSAILIGGVYPAAVQQFKVRPSEAAREAPYIQHNIDATREAYGLTKAEVTRYDAQTKAQAGQLRADADTTASIRLLDPNIVSPTFRQEQQILRFYSFPDTLRVDRYVVKGDDGKEKKEDVVVAVRELNLDNVPAAQRNWINDHLLYTHGYGFVAARGNTVNENGAPTFVSQDIPTKGQLGEFEPRIYFGEESPEYSIVGSADGRQREYDYPVQGGAQVNNTYQGKGGVSIGSFWRQLLYAVKFKEEKILLSQDINPKSQVLYVRDPSERVNRVAPWLTLDRDPYPAIVGGRVTWVIDGYTTSANYPYASRTTLGHATETTLTANDQRIITPRDEVNYIRNSVKATVDAYDGTVTLYAWNQDKEPDPVLKTWMKAFPGTVQEKIPANLLEHLRYPEDYFKVQRQMLSRYHVTNPGEFYSKADFWQIPTDPTAGEVTALAGSEAEAQPPYYLTLRMPDDKVAAFSLTTTFEPVGRPQLAAFMAVNAEPGPDYGKIQVLQLPSTTTVAGPRQAQNLINSSSEVANKLADFRITNKVKYGNLLTLPVGDGLLYVEPLYVQQSGQNAFPLLRAVIVAFGNDVAMEGTLKEALDKLFQGESGAETAEQGGSGSSSGSGSGTGSTGGSGSKNANAALLEALTNAQKAFEQGQAALKAGDFSGYGTAQKDLKNALDRAAAAQARLNGGTSSSATPSTAPTPGASPSPAATPKASTPSARAASPPPSA